MYVKLASQDQLRAREANDAAERFGRDRVLAIYAAHPNTAARSFSGSRSP